MLLDADGVTEADAVVDAVVVVSFRLVEELDPDADPESEPPLLGSALGAGIGVELADDLEAALALDADGDGVVATVVADRHFFVVAEHCRDLQSVDLVHPSPALHGVHFPPPQSTSVSSPFLILSVQVPAGILDGDGDGVVPARHVPPVQTRLTQSVTTWHLFPTAHAGHATDRPPGTAELKPPQSTSVSRPFLLPSEQVPVFPNARSWVS